METHRIYNRGSAVLRVMIEPWGTSYDVPCDSYLGIYLEGEAKLTEFNCFPDSVQVFFNGPEYDEEKTVVLPI